MKNQFIVVAFFLALMLVFTSCTTVIENSAFDTNGYLIIDGEKTVPEYLLKIDDNNVSFAEYRYYYLNQKSELDGGDETIWSDYPEYVSTLKEYVESTLIEVYSIRELSEEFGVVTDFDAVDSQIKEYKKGLSSSEYKKGLSDFYLTEELYEYILQGYQLYTNLFDHLYGENGEKAMSEQELLDYVEDNYTHAKHILIYPNTTMKDEDYEALLLEVLEKARNGEDFDLLIEQYSNDDAMPSYGYYFSDEEMPEEFVLACDGMEAGEISDIIKSSHGYHIIKKLPIDAGDLESLTDVVYNKLFAEIIDEKIKNAKVEYSSEYQYVSPSTVK